MKRNERFERKNDGAVGIGTLIVFIAMVLVAAIAAAVLINTSGSLQDRAQKTGAEATEDVSGGLKVQHMQGWVHPTIGQMGILRLYLSLHAGTDAVNIQDELAIHLSFVDMAGTGASGGQADLLWIANSDLGPAAPETCDPFTYNITVDPHGSLAGSGALDQDSLMYVDIILDGAATHLVNATVAGTAPAGGGFDPGSHGVVKFLISSGMTPTLKGFNVPGSFPAAGGWIELY